MIGRLWLLAWLLALDQAHAVGAPRWLYLWLLERASDATDWGPPLEGDDAPW